MCRLVRLLGVLGLGAGAAGSASLGVSPLRAEDDGLTYALVDTWSRAPWQLVAGRYAEVADVSSSPEGTVFVLDGHQRAIHVLAADGRPGHVFRVFSQEEMYEGWRPARLDAAWDGSVYLLSAGRRLGTTWEARVDRFAATGTRLAGFRLTLDTETSLQDIAVHPDGRLALARAQSDRPPPYPCLSQTPAPPGPPTPPATATAVPPPALVPMRHGVDIYGAAGVLLSTVGLACPAEGVDVAEDGLLYVIQRCPDPGPPPCPSPGPTATARPSLLDRPQQADGGVAESGVLVFGADGGRRRWVPFNGAEDIAVGPAGVFLTRHVEIFALGEREPLYSGPSGQVVVPVPGRTVFHVDVPARGGLLAGMNHCYFQGMAVFDRPVRPAPAPAFLGALDRPELEGPVYPMRLAASGELAVLLGRYLTWGPRPDPEYQLSTSSGLPQSVQRWLRRGIVPGGGRLQSQLGVCGGSDAWWTHDVAMDGRTVYTIDPNVLQRRPDDRLPAGSYSPGAWAEPSEHPWLAGVAAGAGRVALLDIGDRRVRLLDEELAPPAEWPSDSGGNALPVDIALTHDRVLLADLGQSQVRVHGLNGELVAAWPTHDGPRRLAAGPDGDAYVLGRGGWGYRYSPTGRLRAAWTLPQGPAEPLDLAVDADGNVYVSFIELAPQAARDPLVRGWLGPTIRRAGVWVFEPRALPAQPESAPQACLARPDKWATPRRLPLGREVEVTLEVSGRCPGHAEPAQIAIAFDVSRSMSFNNALDRARDGTMDLVGMLDSRSTEVALVTFAEGATLDRPLGHDLAALRARLAGLVAADNTRLAPALVTAQAELTGRRGNAAARRIILVVTDGVPKDDPRAAVAAARAAGLDLVFLVYPTSELNATHLEALRQLAGDEEAVILEPDRARRAALVTDLTGYREPHELFASIQIDDVVPQTMRYVEGSAEPPVAAWDGRTLTWRLAGVKAGAPIRLRYRLMPLRVGVWPTNVVAEARYRDGLAQDGRLVFPVPQVEVYAVAASLYLPFAAARQCFRAVPVDVLLVLDTSSSMLEPTADGRGTKLDAARRAAETFLSLLRLPDDHAGIIGFHHAAATVAELTGDAAALRAGLAGLTSEPGTRIDLGLGAAHAALSRGARPAAQPVVVLLTDGLQNGSTEPVLAQAAEVRRGGALIYTIGLGSATDRELLQAVASTPDGAFASPTAAELASIYRQISERLACESAEPARPGR